MGKRIIRGEEGKKTFIILFVAATLFLLSGILNKSRIADKTLNSSQETGRESAEQDVLTVSSTETSSQYDIQAEHPTSETAAAQAARNYIQDRVDEFRERALATTSSVNTDTQMSFRNSVDVYKAEKFISSVVKINQFTGGANSNQFVASFVANKQSDKLVDITEVVPASQRQEFLRSVKSRLHQTVGAEGGLGSTYRESIKRLDMDDFTDFYVSDQKITVLFSPYTVAPGAAGIISVAVNR